MGSSSTVGSSVRKEGDHARAVRRTAMPRTVNAVVPEDAWVRRVYSSSTW